MSQTQTDSSKYYLPHGSPWPILGSVALFCLMLGGVSYLNGWLGGYVFLPGAILLATMFFCWFGTVIDENQHGVYNLEVDRSFRLGMMWFIFSEVMFFAAFFGERSETSSKESPPSGRVTPSTTSPWVTSVSSSEPPPRSPTIPSGSHMEEMTPIADSRASRAPLSSWIGAPVRFSTVVST